MQYLKVKLWGDEIGRLVWDSATRQTYFMYNPRCNGEIPDFAPLLSPSASRNLLLPIYGDERPLYQGLPPFIADSLPDSWGNTLFDKWVKDNKIPRNQLTPLYKLMFIGTRGMGALEYEPYAPELAHTRTIDIKSLYDISLRVLHERDSMVLDSNEEITLQALLAVGTSAGGRQMKAVLAIDTATGEIRSGQSNLPESFEYYILKFGDHCIPTAEIEMAFCHMAIDSGIDMEACRLLPVEGITHFLTRRFDRKQGRKIHVQTLAAINPEARSYEDLIATCRELSLPESEIEQIYLRMVFNVLSNNTDDHNKNFSFLLEENGKWRFAPAYDVTFIFNIQGTGPNTERRMSIGGKTFDLTKADLLDFAKQNDIRNAGAIIDRVAEVVGRFNEYAGQYGIRQPWRGIINKALSDNLISFGYLINSDSGNASFIDSYGRFVADVSVNVNAKGHYEVTALIDGRRQRRFVRPKKELYSELSQSDIFDLPHVVLTRLIEVLFPPE